MNFSGKLDKILTGKEGNFSMYTLKQVGNYQIIAIVSCDPFRTGKITFEMEEIIGKVARNRKYIAIATRIFTATQMYLHGYDAYIASETLKPDYISFIFPKGSPLRKHFNLL